jgi:phenylacetaldehyde dehydrogenase
VTTTADRRTDAEDLDRPLTMLIDGQWVPARGGALLDVYDPSTGELLAQVASGDATDVDRAVDAARRSFEDGRWRRLSAADRGVILWRVADLLQAEAEALARLESRNLGMPLAQSRGLVAEAINQFRYFAGWADKVTGITLDLGPSERRIQGYTLREPVGVAALIVPWNAPILAAAQKVAPALVAGCSVILKPAEETPLTALVLGRILLEAGVPEGVVNIVTGLGSATGAPMAEHNGIDKLAFTGSTEVGKTIVRAASGNLKKLTLELGGKSPVIVLADADVPTAIAGIAGGIFWNTGQVCSAGTRLFVHDRIFDEVVEGVADAGRRLKIGGPFDDGVDLGPLISAKQLSRVSEYVSGGVASGARLVSGGHRVGETGYFFEPTVVAQVDQSMPMIREEIFGPVIGAMRFSNVDEAIAAANDTDYGLAASVWTSDAMAAHSLARRIRAGRVGINVHRAGGAHMPMGGYKQSGWGRESGVEAIHNYLETKSVVAQLGREFD